MTPLVVSITCDCGAVATDVLYSPANGLVDHYCENCERFIEIASYLHLPQTVDDKVIVVEEK